MAGIVEPTEFTLWWITSNQLYKFALSTNSKYITGSWWWWLIYIVWHLFQTKNLREGIANKKKNKLRNHSIHDITIILDSLKISHSESNTQNHNKNPPKWQLALNLKVIAVLSWQFEITITWLEISLWRWSAILYTKKAFDFKHSRPNNCSQSKHLEKHQDEIRDLVEFNFINL